MRRDVGAAVAAGLMAVAAAHGQALPTIDASGTVHAPASTVPVSSLLTPEAKAAFIARYTAPARRKPGDFAPADGARRSPRTPTTSFGVFSTATLAASPPADRRDGPLRGRRWRA
jgi:hypothetical protein